MSTLGVVEQLRTSPERWEFLLRIEDGEAVNVELRGVVHGALRDGDRVELLESREIHWQEVTVASRVRNQTLRSTVTVTTPRRRERAAAFLMPTSIWTPIGGLGAAGMTLVFTSRGQTPSASPTPTAAVTSTPTQTSASPTATATATPPVMEYPETGGDHQLLAPILLAGGLLLLVALAGLLTLRARSTQDKDGAGGSGSTVAVSAVWRRLRSPRASELLRFGAFVVLGVMAGFAVRLII